MTVDCTSFIIGLITGWLATCLGLAGVMLLACVAKEEPRGED